MSIADLYSQALTLPPGDRETLALQLLASIPESDESQPRVADVELLGEISRRIADCDAGRAMTVDLETFAAAVRSAARPNHAP
jgi:putative addiction module component (TIGR02574 family)